MDTSLKEEKTEREQMIIKNLQALGSPCKELLYQYYFYNNSMNEIAKSMNYASPKAARNQKYKCMERLRKKILGKHK